MSKGARTILACASTLALALAMALGSASAWGKGNTPRWQQRLPSNLQKRDDKGRFAPGKKVFNWYPIKDLKPGDVVDTYSEHRVVKKVEDVPNPGTFVIENFRVTLLGRWSATKDVLFARTFEGRPNQLKTVRVGPGTAKLGRVGELHYSFEKKAARDKKPAAAGSP